MPRQAMDLEESCREYARRANMMAMRRRGRAADPSVVDEHVLRDMERDLDEPSFKAMRQKVERDAKLLRFRSTGR